MQRFESVTIDLDKVLYLDDAKTHRPTPGNMANWEPCGVKVYMAGRIEPLTFLGADARRRFEAVLIARQVRG